MKMKMSDAVSTRQLFLSSVQMPAMLKMSLWVSFLASSVDYNNKIKVLLEYLYPHLFASRYVPYRRTGEPTMVRIIFISIAKVLPFPSASTDDAVAVIVLLEVFPTTSIPSYSTFEKSPNRYGKNTQTPI